MAYYVPIFCRGRSSVKICGAVSANVSYFAINNSNGAYIIGSPCFISNNDFTDPQWLGAVRAAVSSYILTTLPTAKATTTESSVLWIPTSSAQFAYPHKANTSPTTDLGVSVLTSRGSIPLPTRYADKIKSMELQWSGVPVGEYAKLEAFIEDHCDDGILEFTAAWKNYGTGLICCDTVIKTGTTLTNTLDSINTESFSITLQIKNSNAYVG